MSVLHGGYGLKSSGPRSLVVHPFTVVTSKQSRTGLELIPGKKDIKPITVTITATRAYHRVDTWNNYTGPCRMGKGR